MPHVSLENNNQYLEEDENPKYDADLDSYISPPELSENDTSEKKRHYDTQHKTGISKHITPAIVLFISLLLPLVLFIGNQFIETLKKDTLSYVKNNISGEVLKVKETNSIANLILMLSLVDIDKGVTKAESIEIESILDYISKNYNLENYSTFHVILNKITDIFISSNNSNGIHKIFLYYKDVISEYPEIQIKLVRYNFLEYIKDYSLNNGDFTSFDHSILEESVKLMQSNTNTGRASFYKSILASSKENFEYKKMTAAYIDDIMSSQEANEFIDEYVYILNNTHLNTVTIFLNEFIDKYKNEIIITNIQ